MPATYLATSLRLAALVLIVTACATVPSTQYGSGAPARSPHLLTAEDISRVQVTSAYEAVERLKPNFLVGMRGESIRAVYLNGTRLLGGLENLRTIDAATIQQIVFLNGMEASTLYGSGTGAGVLLVSTLPARRR